MQGVLGTEDLRPRFGFLNWEHKIPAGANIAVDEAWESEGMKTCNVTGQGTSGCHDEPELYLCGAHGHYGAGCGGGGALAFNAERNTVRLIDCDGGVVGQVYLREPVAVE
jgi:hypothetical protein